MRKQFLQASRKSSVFRRDATKETQILLGFREHQLPGIHYGKVISDLSSVSTSVHYAYTYTCCVDGKNLPICRFINCHMASCLSYDKIRVPELRNPRH